MSVSLATREEWRPVVGYEGFYDVSNRGRIKSIEREDSRHTGRVLSPGHPRGRPHINLFKHGRASAKRHYVHILVLEAFVSPRLPGMQCNHLDGDKANNRVPNLEWGTQFDNMRHAFDNGLIVAAHGEKNGQSKLTEGDVRRARALIASGVTRVAIGKILGVHNTTITAIHTGKSWGWLK